MGAAAVTHGEIRIKDAGVQHLGMIKLVLRRLGVDFDFIGDDILVGSNQRLVIEPISECHSGNQRDALAGFSNRPDEHRDCDCHPVHRQYPFHDWMYPSRMFFTDKLVSMGRQIVLCDPHRCIVQGTYPSERRKTGQPRHPRRHRAGVGGAFRQWHIDDLQYHAN